ncbi:Protein misato-like 1 [Hondaea fermentalgiana]|uniref:Protein misato-like 1 n=1 Tax=Hondaea fermentalgiana TaxID=2315210 RepID=A0A2R5G3R9_9STRA|nr:Protein misato-like 1 [Hondaea fermentalgiana]|eukprot:GBG25662.1 Protein misato-like 1 [Hondaea fermentalgiana]
MAGLGWSSGGGGGELLTLQLGRASNYVGAHFWNAQDELLEVDRAEDGTTQDGAAAWVESVEDAAGGGRAAAQVSREMRPERLFRVSEHAATPRLVAIDFRRRVGALKPLSALTSSAAKDIFELSDESLAQQSADVWDGPVQVSREAPTRQNAFLDWLEQGASAVEGVALGAVPPPSAPSTAKVGHEGADEDAEQDLYESKRIRDSDVTSWGDFLKAQVHEKSIQLLHRQGDADFEAFTSGHDTALQGGQLDDIIESVRFYLEECDRLQGVHALVDINTGFGSIGQTVLQEIREEARSAAIWCLGIVGPNPHPSPSHEKYASAMRKRAMNEAVALATFSRLCHLYTPVPLYNLKADAARLALPYLAKDRFHADSLFHTSALVGAALDVASTPYRLVETPNGPNGAATLAEMCARVGPSEDSRIAGLQMALPFPHPNISPDELKELLANAGALHEAKNPFGVDLSSVLDAAHPKQQTYKVHGASVVLRGNTPSRHDAVHRRNLTDSLGVYLGRTRFTLTPMPLSCAAATPYPITLAHPDIFRNQVLGSAGEIAVGRSAPPVTMPSLVSLASSTRLATNVAAAQASIRTPGLALQLEFAKGAAGLGNDELTAMREDLDNNIAPAYGLEVATKDESDDDLDN